MPGFSKIHQWTAFLMTWSTTTSVTSPIQCVVGVYGGSGGGESEGFDFYCVSNQL